MSTHDLHSDEEELPVRNRVEVLRDVVIFQLKLVIDGLRDLLLIPSSFFIGVYSALVSRKPGEPFYRLLRAGHATERWIDLFGEAYEREDDDDTSTRERYAARWQAVEEKLRDVERSLEKEDHRSAARDGAKQLRDTLKRYF